jgi:hypothetical protein
MESAVQYIIFDNFLLLEDDGLTLSLINKDVAIDVIFLYFIFFLYYLTICWFHHSIVKFD